MIDWNLSVLLRRMMMMRANNYIRGYVGFRNIKRVYEYSLEVTKPRETLLGVPR